jgi:hypothetical protein
LFEDGVREGLAEGARICGKPLAAEEIAREILAVSGGSLR